MREKRYHGNGSTGCPTGCPAATPPDLARELDPGHPRGRRAHHRSAGYRFAVDHPAGGQGALAPGTGADRHAGRVVRVRHRDRHDPGGPPGRSVRAQAPAGRRGAVVLRRHHAIRAQPELHDPGPAARPVRPRHGPGVHHAVLDRLGVRLGDHPHRLRRSARNRARCRLSAATGARHPGDAAFRARRGLAHLPGDRRPAGDLCRGHYPLPAQIAPLAQPGRPPCGSGTDRERDRAAGRSRHRQETPRSGGGARGRPGRRRAPADTHARRARGGVASALPTADRCHDLRCAQYSSRCSTSA